MKRLILGLMALLMVSPLLAVDSTNKTRIINLTSDAFDALDVYYVKAGTETGASIEISRSTITLTTVGGFNPGSTMWVNTDGAFATIDEFVAWVEMNDSTATATAAKDTAFRGLEGNWVMSVKDTTDGGNNAWSLADATPQDVFSSTNTKTLDFFASSMTYYSVPLPAVAGKNIVVSAIISSVTFSGVANMAIVDTDGDYVTPPIVLPSKDYGIYTYPPTPTGAPIAIRYTPYIKVWNPTVNGTQAITGGWIYVMYHYD